MTRRRIWIGTTLLLGIAALVGAVLYVTHRGTDRFEGGISALAVDLAQPQGYVATPALSRLPRDLVKAPVLRDVLDEDFAFYYEEHEDRLDLRGAIKRIAYEHQTTLGDQLLELALDEPAEIAFWADAKGAPRYWLMAMTRGVLAKTLQGLATVAASDRQLSVVDTLHVGDAPVAAYALRLSPRRTLVFLSLGERVVVLSDAGLLFDAEHKPGRAAGDVVAGLLSADAQQQGVYRRNLGLGQAGSGHTIVFDAQLLSFGYQHFFPGLKALRFDVAPGGTSIQTHLRVAGAAALPAATSAAPWGALPADPAACALLPVDWAEVKRVLTRPAEAASTEASASSASSSVSSSSASASASASTPTLPAAAASGPDASQRGELADQLDGPAAVCWYARSQLHTPIWLVHLKDSGPRTSAALDALWQWLSPADAAEPAHTTQGGVQRWQGEVTASWGPHGDKDEASYRPTLALQNGWLAFSPDDRLVELAIDAQAKRYPSVADALPAAAAASLVLAPSQLADLAEREAFAVIQPEQTLFRQAAEQHLLPRLAALRKLPDGAAVPRGAADAQGWVAVDWQPLPGKKGKP